MQLYFVRHGQSENNLLWDNTGSDKGRSDDPLLTDVGHQQAALVAQFLGRPIAASLDGMRDPQNAYGFGITSVYSSLMTRAMQTGYIVARACRLRLIAMKDLHEAGGIYLKDGVTGEFIQRPGKTRAYFETHFPDCVLPADARADGWWNRPSEAAEECLPRARCVLEDLLARHGQTDDRIAVITHGAFYNCLLKALLNLPELVHNGYWFVLNNVAITRVDFDGDNVALAYTNRVDFLPPDLIT